MVRLFSWMSAAFLTLAALSPAAAQEQAPPAPVIEAPVPEQVPPAAVIQTVAQALAQDGAEYAKLYGVTAFEGQRRLAAQAASVAATDRLRALHKDRLAGIAVEHRPDLRIVVLLTGEDVPPDETILAAGVPVAVVYRGGAAATRDQVVDVLLRRRDDILALVPRLQGMGLDQRTGELVILIGDADQGRYEPSVAAELAEMLGVPVRIGSDHGPSTDFALTGGSRVVGIDPADGRRYACTTGFVVTDGARTGVVTAAHCPDSLTYIDPEGGQFPLEFVGGWGARYQDVQIHASGQMLRPLFYADSGKRALRELRTWRNRSSTRAGDTVCRRGETSGYSCSEVDLTDYAPAGALCGGPCDPTWVTVAGPSCRGGDSGGPVFAGTTALGIIKGGNYGRSGACKFYYYMSTDFLPPGWSLLHGSVAPAVAPVPISTPSAVRP